MNGALGLHGTFVPNKSQSIHRWYPYIEGFSNDFVSSLLNEFATKGHTVYDPFAGTGTTVCVAEQLGMKATYSEINPFMRCRELSVIKAAEIYSSRSLQSASEVLGEIRNWKDNF